MGIYLGQLPPAEIARFKAELAETLIANFCYPRFYDYRTDALQTRPVDRAKRQEVWLYLSSVDFTSWSRVDLTSSDFQIQIERLFIQFVQHNRCFFGNQGRRRMPDIRMLISSCAGSVAQGLRNHLTGKRQGNMPFGSPRPVISWSANPLSKQKSLEWEQISSATLILQQQLQEIRGEAKAASGLDEQVNVAARSGRAATGEAASTVTSTSGNNPRVATRASSSIATSPAPTPVTNGSGKGRGEIASPVAPAASVAGSSATAVANPAARSNGAAQVATPSTGSAPISSRSRVDSSTSVPPTPVVRRSQPLEEQGAPAAKVPTPEISPLTAREAPAVARKTGSSSSTPIPAIAPTPVAPPVSPVPTAPALKAVGGKNQTASPALPIDTAAAFTRNAPSSVLSGNGVTSTTSSSSNHRDVMTVGEDDIAIFEQMRHQLILWLRIEAISAGLEIGTHGPAQLLEMLRQQARMDETRLQVVSTLLNLANQVIKTGFVSVLDYKQALMFHLMHTKRA